MVPEWVQWKTERMQWDRRQLHLGSLIASNTIIANCGREKRGTSREGEAGGASQPCLLQEENTSGPRPVKKQPGPINTHTVT
jgi:hypothetical protein